MKLLKKYTALLLSVLLLFTLTACSQEEVLSTAFLILNSVDSSEDVDAAPDAPDTADMSTDAAESDQSGTVTTTHSDGSDSCTIDVPDIGEFTLDEAGDYTTSEDVALYIATYEHLPENFMTKKEARELGWSGGGLDDYAYGMCIGGDYFGNNEGLLPTAKGRVYHECDVNTLHEDKRGAERIIYSNDGLVYYSDDHYETFTLLYGEE